MRTALVLFLFVASASVASGQANETWVQITPTWNLTQSQIDQFTALLPRLEQDTWAWHWGPEKNTIQWDKQGLIDQGELDWYNQQSSGMLAGGGFYLSLDQTDSRNFGIFPLGVLLPKGSLRYESRNSSMMYQLDSILQKRSLSKQEKTALGRIIPFYDLYTSTWMVVHNATLLRNVTLAFRVPEFKPNFGTPNYQFASQGGLFPAMEQLSDLVPTTASSIREMRRYWDLLDFLGPLQANRMRLQYGKNLWSRIDVDKFDRFHKMIEETTRELYSGSNNVYKTIGSFHTFASKPAGMMYIFPILWSSLNDNETMWRKEASWNEGDASIKHYTIVSGEYSDIQASPYLNVEVVEKNSANGTLKVRIEHPSVLNVKKFMHILSPELMRNISYYSHAKIQQDGPLRRILNAKIMEELFVHNLKSICDKEWDSLELSQFLQNMGRIQPFSKDNYLMRKLFERIAMVALLYSSSYNSRMEVIPEVSILFPSYYRYRAQMEDTQSFEVKLRGFNAISKSAFHPDMEVDFFAGWEEFSTNYLTYNPQHSLSFDSKSLEMIKEKRIVDLFDRDFPNWRSIIAQQLDIQISATWFTNRAQISHFAQVLPKFENSTRNYFIWIPSSSIQFGSDGEIKNFTLPKDSNSLDELPREPKFYDSLYLPLVVNIKDDSVVYDWQSVLDRNLVTSNFQINLDEFNIVEIQKYIPLVIKKYGSLQIYEKSIVTNPRVAYSDPNVNFTYSATTLLTENGERNSATTWRVLFGFVKNVVGEEIADKMARHWNLIDFFGTVQANRLRIQYGDQLWDHVDKKFERFHSTQSKMIQASINGTGFKFSNSPNRINFPNPVTKEWVDDLVNVFFASVWGNLTGTHHKMFREQEMWNNGKGKNHTFTVTNDQFDDMMASPYLEVEVLDRNETDKSMTVRFQHPFVYNVSKLFVNKLISKELYSNITSYSKSELKDDDELRGSLNSQMMKELLSNLLRSIGGKNPESMSQFYQDLERALPFSSDNHSIRKIFEKISSFQLGYNSKTHPENLPGIAILMPYRVNSYGGYYQANGFQANIRNNGIDSMIKNFFVQKPIDYFHGWETLKTFYISSTSFNATFDDRTIKLLEREDYFQFLDSCAPKWRDIIRFE